MIQPAALYLSGFVPIRKMLALRKALGCQASCGWCLGPGPDCGIAGSWPISLWKGPRSQRISCNKERGKSQLYPWASVGTWGDQAQLLCAFSCEQRAWKEEANLPLQGLEEHVVTVRCGSFRMLVGMASPHGREGSTRDPPTDPEAVWDGERKGHVRHPGTILIWAEEGHWQDHGSREPSHGANTELLLYWGCRMSCVSTCHISASMR